MSYSEVPSYPYLIDESASADAASKSSLYNLDFHLESREIFSFLAIVFGVIEETLRESTGNVDYQLSLVQQLRSDLLNLQNSHHVQPRELEAA